MKTEYQMPTEKQLDAFRRGEEARKRGAPLYANPFKGENLRDFWMYGWESEDTSRSPHETID